MLTKEENELLTRTGPGTPMGELFRRFWLPALLSSELPEPDGPPVKLTMLSEELVAFRDSDGRVGVLDRYCPHRGSSLYWGRNEEGGLRCVYHGWKFDTAGHCLDMPNEPAGRGTACRAPTDEIRTLAYPTAERGGVVWVYLGPYAPSDRLHPELPELEWTRVPDSHRYVSKRTQTCNYLQNVEGEVDSSHVSFLHGRAETAASRAVASAPAHVQTGVDPVSGFAMNDRSPVFNLKETDYGMLIGARRNAGNNAYYWRITQFLLPTYTMIPSEPGAPVSFTAAVPVDDTHMVGFTATWRPDRPLDEDDIARIESWTGIHTEVNPRSFRPLANMDNDYLIDREKQREGSFTGIRGIREQDLAVQEDQWGRVTKRYLEHLGTTDLAVIGMRRILMREAERLRKGIEPAAAQHGDAYRVRSAALVLQRNVEWVDGARDCLIATR